MTYTTRSNKVCDNNHNHCINLATQIEDTLNNKTPDLILIKTFFDLIITSNNNKCLSTYNNNKSIKIHKIIEMINDNDIIIEPYQYAGFLQYIDEKVCLKIIKNQIKLDKEYCDKLYFEKNIYNSYYSNITFISLCINNSKYEILNYTLDNVSCQGFLKGFTCLRSVSEKNFDKIDNLYKVINKYFDELYQRDGLVINIIDVLINKPTVIKYIYSLISKSKNNTTIKKTILERCIKTYNKELIITILEESTENLFSPELLNILLNQNYFREQDGSYNSKPTAEIIDIFILYGFEITKDFVLRLLDRGCYVNNIEKYKIDIDNELVLKMSNLNYYPYEFSCVPSIDILLIECSKPNNLDKIKLFKEKGGVYNKDCLIKACGVRKNGKVIKYLINDCNIKPDLDCIKSFQENYGIEALDILIHNYSKTNTYDTKVERKIEIEPSILVSIDKRDFDVDLDYSYNIRSKIKKLLNYKKNVITFQELEELFLKYLINQKLVIGNYFVVNHDLCSIIKINQSTLLNIDEVKNIITYFIEK
jgi:hypothetical protein